MSPQAPPDPATQPTQPLAPLPPGRKRRRWPPEFQAPGVVAPGTGAPPVVERRALIHRYIVLAVLFLPWSVVGVLLIAAHLKDHRKHHGIAPPKDPNAAQGESGPAATVNPWRPVAAASPDGAPKVPGFFQWITGDHPDLQEGQMRNVLLAGPRGPAASPLTPLLENGAAPALVWIGNTLQGHELTFLEPWDPRSYARVRQHEVTTGDALDSWLVPVEPAKLGLPPAALLEKRYPPRVVQQAAWLGQTGAVDRMPSSWRRVTRGANPLEFDLWDRVGASEALFDGKVHVLMRDTDGQPRCWLSGPSLTDVIHREGGLQECWIRTGRLTDPTFTLAALKKGDPLDPIIQLATEPRIVTGDAFQRITTAPGDATAARWQVDYDAVTRPDEPDSLDAFKHSIEAASRPVQVVDEWTSELPPLDQGFVYQVPNPKGDSAIVAVNCADPSAFESGKPRVHVLLDAPGVADLLSLSRKHMVVPTSATTDANIVVARVEDRAAGTLRSSAMRQLQVPGPLEMPEMFDRYPLPMVPPGTNDPPRLYPRMTLAAGKEQRVLWSVQMATDPADGRIRFRPVGWELVSRGGVEAALARNVFLNAQGDMVTFKADGSINTQKPFDGFPDASKVIPTLTAATGPAPQAAARAASPVRGDHALM